MMKIFEVRIPVTFDLKVEAESREEAEKIVTQKLAHNGYHFDIMNVNFDGWLNFHNEAITEAEIWVNIGHLEDSEWDES